MSVHPRLERGLQSACPIAGLSPPGAAEAADPGSGLKSALHSALVVVLLLALGACSDSGPGATAADSASDVTIEADQPSGDLGDLGVPDLTDAVEDAATDLVVSDAPDLPDAAELLDATPSEPDAAECPDPAPTDYACDAGDPATCPEGFCVFGQCIGPVVDPDRWADCGDGTCGPCEDAASCPADCGEPPVLVGELDYDPAQTITVDVHGFQNVGASDFEDQTYGEARGGGAIELLLRYAPDRVDGRFEPDAPNQVVGVEYYGAVPPADFSEDEVAAIEAWSWQNEEALHRYALIVATFVDHRLEATGASHANLSCHSMGCHVIRYMLEHDLRGLASRRKIARWTSLAGVIAGARLARLYDNPVVQQVGGSLGINTADFIHMHPDYVADHSAVWDHHPDEANNPLFEGILLHEVVGTYPEFDQGGVPIRLLDLNNPGDEPNDGLVFTLDEYFHDQAEPVRAVALSGDRLRPTWSALQLDHFTLSDDPGAALMTAASLYHSRKVILTLREVHLLDDRESDGPLDFDEHGTPPAEVAAEVTVRYDPYVSDTFGESLVVHHQEVADRSPELRTIAEGETRDLDLILFQGPVFDAMTSLNLELELLEVDQYPRFGLTEWPFDPHQRLLAFAGSVALEDGELALANGRLEATVEVRVEQLYEPAAEEAD